MINTLSEWAKNLCLSMVVVSLLEMILPNNKTKKYINVVMGLYILFNILSPIISNSSNMDSNNIDIEKYINKTLEETSAGTSKEDKIENSDVDQSSMNARLEQLYSEELENDITKKLENKGYLVNSCKVKCNLDGKNDGIEKITIKISKSENIENDSKRNNKKNSENYNSNNIINNNEESSKSYNSNKSTNEDILKIKDFITKEYGVDEKCLKIN